MLTAIIAIGVTVIGLGAAIGALLHSRRKNSAFMSLSSSLKNISKQTKQAFKKTQKYTTTTSRTVEDMHKSMSQVCELGKLTSDLFGMAYSLQDACNSFADTFAPSSSKTHKKGNSR